jgi:CHAT domain-containing protein
MPHLHLLAVVLALVRATGLVGMLALPPSAVVAAGVDDSALDRGIAQCDGGSYALAAVTLGEAYRREPAGPARAKAAGALGLAHLRMRQTSLARDYLREAYETSTDPVDRARHALDLANLEAGQRRSAEAVALYDAVLRLAPADAGLKAAAALNRIPLAPAADRLVLLEQARLAVGAVPRAQDRAAFLLNLGLQARAIRSDPRALRLAYGVFTEATAIAQGTGDARLMAGARNELAQLYEDEGRNDEAMRLSAEGVQSAQAPEARELLIPLEWRRGRLLARQGRLSDAISAYQRAVDQIEAVRLDIPIEYDNGRSSFRDTLEPVYLGLADLLLRQASQLGSGEQTRQFLRTRQTLERIKQTELEDFLGNRCSLEAAGRGARSTAGATRVAAGTAVLYPVILPDRLELLLETASGIVRRTVPVSAATLRQDATAFAAALRFRRAWEGPSQRLHDALLAPVAETLAKQRVETLVVVPDSVLRLVPFGALHDGQSFAIERFAVTVVPAVTLQDGGRPHPRRRSVSLLLAGVSEPGQVVEKLPAAMTAQLLAGAPPVAPSGTRAIFPPEAQRNLVVTENAASRPDALPGVDPSATDKAARQRLLQQRLALAGVAEEIGAIARLAPSTVLLDERFSVRAFSDRVASGEYRVVHIASHGVFGSTADATFVLAHDDLITIDRLQALLRGPALRRQPIDLLTLSACETAEGDDRAPLGLSGAALKAQARSALGSLWPVSDVAATRLMGSFYGNLVGGALPGAAKALQDAQVRMIGQPGLQHPYYWAPFILVERRL